jgi:branched-subunit amino acid aminotransferase/4-amino-4-deoxychorismate lyase
MLCWENTPRGFQLAPGIPASDRGFRYGMSVFESLRLQDGCLHLARAHWKRLLEAAHQLAFPPPPETAFEASLAPLRQLSGSWFVRWYLTAGDGPPTGPVFQPRLWLIAEARPRSSRPPVALGIHPSPFPRSFAGLKTGNYWPRLEALAAAQREGFAECLLLNPEARLSSAACSNVFVHLPGQGWITPPLADGARNGVVRSWLLRQRDIRAQEASLRSSQLKAIDAALLCNSWTGLLPVSRLEDRPLRVPPEINLWTQRLESDSQLPDLPAASSPPLPQTVEPLDR